MELATFFALSAGINLNLDLLNFAFVRLFVCVGITSFIYELESDSSAYIPLPRSILGGLASRSSFLIENSR